MINENNSEKGYYDDKLNEIMEYEDNELYKNELEDINF